MSKHRSFGLVFILTHLLIWYVSCEEGSVQWKIATNNSQSKCILLLKQKKANVTKSGRSFSVLSSCTCLSKTEPFYCTQCMYYTYTYLSFFDALFCWLLLLCVRVCVQAYTKINSFKTNKHNLSWSLQKLDFSSKLIISFCKSFRHLHWIERSQTESLKINARTNFRIRSQVVRTSVKMSQQKH